MRHAQDVGNSGATVGGLADGDRTPEACVAGDFVSSPCTCFTVRRAARHLTQAYDRHLAESGLRSTQFVLLRHLNVRGPISVQRLARLLGMDRTTLARNLRPLEREELVSISIDPNDRRGRLLAVTERGAKRLQLAQPLWADAQQQFEAAFGPTELPSLHHALDAIALLPIG